MDARRAFLLVSRTLRNKTEEIHKIESALGERHAGTFDGVAQHTTRTSVSAAARAALDAKADLVVAVGGGSVIDAAKMAILCVEHGFTDEHLEGLDPFAVWVDAERKFHRPIFRGPSLRMIAVPSTLNGGEYNGGCLVTDERRKLKQSFYHPEMMPRVIVLDPELARHTPGQLWLGSGTRALDHAIEAWLSVTSTPLSDAVVLNGIERMVPALRAWRKDPDNIALRSECQIASWLCSYGIGSHGRQGRVMMGGSHAIGHVLGGTCDVPHYFCTPVLMAGLLRWLMPRTAQRQARLAQALGFPGIPAAEAFDMLVRELGLPARLSDVGVDSSQFELIGDLTMKEVFINGSRRAIATPADVVEILKLAA